LGPRGPLGGLARFPSGKASKWILLGFWLVVLVLAVAPAGKLTGAQENDAVSWLPGDAESTQVLQEMGQFQSSDEIPAIVVYERPGGVTPDDLAAVARQVSDFNDVEGVERDAVGPIPSEDQEALQVIVPVDAGSGGWESLAAAVESMRDIGADGPEGLTVHFTGPGGFAADSSEAFAGIDGKLLYSAIAVVVVILLFTYRSPLLWILPVFASVVALLVAQAVIYLLATRADLTVNAQSAGILTVLVFGAGTDYALLLVARYREELRRHQDRHEAMAFALRRSGPAIFASGATVIAGMLCLLVASMNSTQGLGPVAAIGVAVALGVMLTLLPALLVIFGRWVVLAPAPVVRLDRPVPDRAVGAGGQPDRAPPADDLGSHLVGARCRRPRHPAAERERPAEQGRLLRNAGVGGRRAGSGRPLPCRLRATSRSDREGRSGR